MRLIVMDVDSTLIQDEVIDLLADRAGCAAEVAEVTESAMRGELDFAASLRERVALLAGLDAGVLDEVRRQPAAHPGRAHADQDAEAPRLPVRDRQRRLHLGHRSRWPTSSASTTWPPTPSRSRTGKLTGRGDRSRSSTGTGKTEALRRFAQAAGVPLSQTVAVGDGANDLGMIGAAGLGVAFNAKPVVRDAADTAVNVPYLDTILYLLGIPRDAVDAADQAAE